MECVENNPPKKIKLKRNIDSNILGQFWDLVDASDIKRSRAAEQLLSALLTKQSLVNRTGGPFKNPKDGESRRKTPKDGE